MLSSLTRLAVRLESLTYVIIFFAGVILAEGPMQMGRHSVQVRVNAVEFRD